MELQATRRLFWLHSSDRTRLPPQVKTTILTQGYSNFGLACAVPDLTPTPRGPRGRGRERLRQIVQKQQAGGTTGNGHFVPVAGTPPGNPAPKPPRFPGGFPAPLPYPSWPTQGPATRGTTPGGTGRTPTHEERTCGTSNPRSHLCASVIGVSFCQRVLESLPRKQAPACFAEVRFWQGVGGGVENDRYPVFTQEGDTAQKRRVSG
jgi:hypothetical protein